MIVERARRPYCNPWFLSCKNLVGHCLDNSFTAGIRYTILDGALPPRVDEFSEAFAVMVIASIINVLSGYHQLELVEESRDITGVRTPLRQMWMTSFSSDISTVMDYVLGV